MYSNITILLIEVNITTIEGYVYFFTSRVICILTPAFRWVIPKKGFVMLKDMLNKIIEQNQKKHREITSILEQKETVRFHIGSPSWR